MQSSPVPGPGPWTLDHTCEFSVVLLIIISVAGGGGGGRERDHRASGIDSVTTSRKYDGIITEM